MHTRRTQQSLEQHALARIPIPTVIAGHLLWFDSPAPNDGTHGLITLGWRLEDALNTDPWSARFNAFKFGDPRHLRAACELTAHALQLIRWTTIPGAIGIAAAISADDERPDPASRPVTLAHHLAKHFGFEYRADILRKRHTRALHTLLHIADRTAEISGSYVCTEPPDCALLMVCDDFVTTGATFADIARAIHTRSPITQVIGFAIAKNERQRYAAKNGITLTNDHIPPSWTNLWERYARIR